MTKTQIKSMTNEELLSAFYWVAVRTTNEENHRGVTKKTAKEESYLMEEVTKRFGLDGEVFKNSIIK